MNILEQVLPVWIVALSAAIIVLSVITIYQVLCIRKNLERAVIVLALAMCFFLPTSLKVPVKPRAELYSYWSPSQDSQQVCDPRQPVLSEVLGYGGNAQSLATQQPSCGEVSMILCGVQQQVLMRAPVQPTRGPTTPFNNPGIQDSAFSNPGIHDSTFSNPGIQ